MSGVLFFFFSFLLVADMTWAKSRLIILDEKKSKEWNKKHVERINLSPYVFADMKNFMTWKKEVH